jgi:hypothetical protein
MKDAITVRAVMAFLLLAAATSVPAAEDAEESHAEMTWGDAEPCEGLSLAESIAFTDAESSVLAAYVQQAMGSPYWIRVVRRGERLRVETSGKRDRQVEIEPAVAERIHSLLAADLSRNAFHAVTDELQIDGVWYLFTADGATCSELPWLARNGRAAVWSEVFNALYGRTGRQRALLAFWLDDLEHKPGTLPTSLEAARDGVDIPGAPLAWRTQGAPPLAIANHRARIHDGKLIIVGEVKNELDSARRDVKVVATFLDANGAELDSEDCDVDFDLLPEGGRSPFRLEADVDDVDGAAAYTLRIEPGDWARARAPSIRVTRTQARNDDEDLAVSGTVLNHGSRAEDSVEVAVNLYDAAGNLLASESESIGDTLRPGRSATFEVRIERPAGYHHYAVLVTPSYLEASR